MHDVGTSPLSPSSALQTVQAEIRSLNNPDITQPESHQQRKQLESVKPKTTHRSPPPAAPIIDNQIIDTNIAPLTPPTTAKSNPTNSDNIASLDPPAVTQNTPAPSTDLEVAANNKIDTSNTSDTKKTKTSTTALPRYNVQAPPSVTLQYDVQAWRGEQNLHGSSKMRWQTNGSTYQLEGDTSVLFLNFLTFKSQGVIDEYGIAPVLYNEKRWRKPETNTHFHRERNLISFSASTITYPRQGGEQDRASVIWQLAGIGRGEGEKFQAGKEIAIFLAGVRDAEIWRFQVIGLEQIDVDTGKIAAWHIMRTPRPGSYEQGLEIWLAPQQEWYPVKLRYTETNGDHLDMIASNITPIKAPTLPSD